MLLLVATPLAALPVLAYARRRAAAASTAPPVVASSSHDTVQPAEQQTNEEQHQAYVGLGAILEQDYIMEASPVIATPVAVAAVESHADNEAATAAAAGGGGGGESDTTGEAASAADLQKQSISPSSPSEAVPAEASPPARATEITVDTAVEAAPAPLAAADKDEVAPSAAQFPIPPLGVNTIISLPSLDAPRTPVQQEEADAAAADACNSPTFEEEDSSSGRNSTSSSSRSSMGSGSLPVVHEIMEVDDARSEGPGGAAGEQEGSREAEVVESITLASAPAAGAAAATAAFSACVVEDAEVQDRSTTSSNSSSWGTGPLPAVEITEADDGWGEGWGVTAVEQEGTREPEDVVVVKSVTLATAPAAAAAVSACVVENAEVQDHSSGNDGSNSSSSSMGSGPLLVVEEITEEDDARGAGIEVAALEQEGTRDAEDVVVVESITLASAPAPAAATRAAAAFSASVVEDAVAEACSSSSSVGGTIAGEAAAAFDAAVAEACELTTEIEGMPDEDVAANDLESYAVTGAAVAATATAAGGGGIVPAEAASPQSSPAKGADAVVLEPAVADLQPQLLQKQVWEPSLLTVSGSVATEDDWRHSSDTAEVDATAVMDETGAYPAELTAAAAGVVGGVAAAEVTGAVVKKPRKLRPIKNTKKLVRALSGGLANGAEALMRRNSSSVSGSSMIRSASSGNVQRTVSEPGGLLRRSMSALRRKESGGLLMSLNTKSVSVGGEERQDRM